MSKKPVLPLARRVVMHGFLVRVVAVIRHQACYVLIPGAYALSHTAINTLRIIVYDRSLHPMSWMFLRRSVTKSPKSRVRFDIPEFGRPLWLPPHAS
jgi:hypothetical protein